MRPIRILSALFLCALSLLGCTPSRSDGALDQPTRSLPPVQPVPSGAELDGKGSVEALALANQWMGNGVTTHVTAQSVNFEFPGGETASVALPQDEMVVAIAPYISRTHPCETHYMSGCQGELVGEPISVLAQLADGTVLIDKTISTMENGFIELWLPRGQEVQIRLGAKGLFVEGAIGTFADSQTCITTLKLL